MGMGQQEAVQSHGAAVHDVLHIPQGCSTSWEHLQEFCGCWMGSGSQPRLWLRAGAQTQLRAGIPQLLVKGGIAQVQLQKGHKNTPSSPWALMGVEQH